MKKQNIDAVAAKAGTWYTIANMLLKGCVFFSLPIFTRILSTEDFGAYNTYMAYEGILTAILGLGLYGTVKNAKLDFEDNFNKYLSSVLTMSLSFLAIVLIMSNVFYNLYSSVLEFSRFVTNCLILQSFGSYLIYFYGSKLNIEFKYKAYIGLCCFNTIGNITLSVVLVLFVFPNERYLGRILGSALPLIVIGIIIAVTILIQGRTLYRKEFWKYAARLGIPLIPHVVSQSLLSQFDRIMIRNMVGSSQAGIYSYIYTICTIMYVICSSFDNAWTPWVFLTLRKGDKAHIKTAARDYLLFFSALTLGFICVMPEFTKLIAGSNYWDGIDLLVPLTLANYFIFLYMMPVNIEYYNKKTKYISVGTVSAALLNMVLNYFAIILWGYKAAAYTTLISYLLLFIFHWRIARKFDFNSIYDIKSFLSITIVLLIVSATVLVSERWTLFSVFYRYGIAFTILILFYKERKKLIGVIRGHNSD